MLYGCFIFSGEEVFDAVWCMQFTHEVTAITFLGNHLRVTHLLKMVKNEHHVCSLQGRKPLCTGPKQVIIFTFCNWTRSCIFLCRAHETCLLDPVPLHVFSATTTDKPLEKPGRYTARMWLNLTQKVCEKVNKPPIVWDSPTLAETKTQKRDFHLSILTRHIASMCHGGVACSYQYSGSWGEMSRRGLTASKC